MPLLIHIPAYFNVRSMYSVIGAAIADHQPRSDAFVFDFSRLAFAEPDGMTVLSNLIEWLKKRGVKTGFVGCNPTKAATKYMDDCGFFKEYAGQPLVASAELRSTTQQIRKITCEQCHGWLDQVMPWASDCLETNEASLSEIKTGIREIFFNIDDHSTENIGCAHVQWFPQGRFLHFSISDFGVGIPKELATAHKVNNDAHALALAIKEGISSKQNGRNRGAGLSYLLDNVVGRHSGWIGIYSNGGRLTCSKATGSAVSSTAIVQGFYPGTLVSIILWTDRLVRTTDGREDLEW